MLPGTSAFADFVRRKEDAARAARFESFSTVIDRAARFRLDPLESPLTSALLDGPLFQSPARDPVLPVMNLVFVQSAGGNTGADNPSDLGGGETDKHLIYEGLSRVAADAVMAGATTIGAGDVVFSVWHPEMVALRSALGKPRHPIQIVATLRGNLPVDDGLIFNAGVPVVVLTTDSTAAALAGPTRSRPWITIIGGSERSLRSPLEVLRREHGVCRISNIGGRTLATAALDGGLVNDIYLTTSPREGGTQGTPMYTGFRPPHFGLVVRKRAPTGIVFEQFATG